MSDPIFLTMTGERHGLVSAGCSSKTSIGRYAQVNHEDQIFSLSLLSGWGYEKHSERRCISFHKFIDKSTPLLALGINENERYFLEFDFYRINQFGHFEKYYFIEIRGASMIALQMNFDTRSGHDTECVTLAYDYIRCRHLIAATEYYHFALPANYNSLFSVQNPIVAARNAAQRSTLNSANVGRLLAAGGIYNQNVEGFAKVAQQLGGDAATGYDQIMNDQTKGLLIAGASIAAGLGLGGLGSINKVEALSKHTTTGKSSNISEKRAYLNNKFGRTGDVNRDINIRGNKEVVRNFMKDSGITKERTIEQYMDGIYLNDRVSVETMNKGKLAYQNQAPGNWQGNWYSLNKNTPPTKLGINPEGNLHGTDTKVSKVTTTYQLQQPVKMLRSTANPALDTWSVPKAPFQTEGGGIQWFSTNKDAWILKK